MMLFKILIHCNGMFYFINLCIIDHKSLLYKRQYHTTYFKNTKQFIINNIEKYRIIYTLVFFRENLLHNDLEMGEKENKYKIERERERENIYGSLI